MRKDAMVYISWRIAVVKVQQQSLVFILLAPTLNYNKSITQKRNLEFGRR